MPAEAAVRLTKTSIRSLAQPKSMRSIIDATQREQRHGLGASFEVAEWGVFCHSETLQISPARFKQVYSDSARKRPDRSACRQSFDA